MNHDIIKTITKSTKLAPEAKEILKNFPMKCAKYNSEKTIADGMKFDSKKEANYYSHLKLLQISNQIISFVRQIPFKFKCKKSEKILFTYYADFVVFKKFQGKVISEVIDVKGYKTPIYRLKKKLIEDQFDIKIIEI